jgi:hypothetical protein
VIIDGKLLAVNEHKAPEESYEPCIDGIIAPISGHKDLGHSWEQTFQGETKQVCCKLVLIDVHDLVTSITTILFNKLIPVSHRLIVGM